MSLTEYLRKRRFEKTPEPQGAATAAGGNRFYIQRHRATRLHYDLRLEIAGTLKSWAVPKGPTLDPAEKRLAVHVEDHPIEYGDFEGTIPAGNYGAGAVTVWDRGTYELLGDKSVGEQLERGDLKFRLHGQKLMGEFALVRTKRGKGNEWLLIKKKDFAAKAGWDAEDHLESVAAGAEPSSVTGAVRAEMPKSVSAMLASIGESVPEGSDWVYELKWDGVRAICYVDAGKVRLVSRRGNNMDAQYPELKELPEFLFAQQAVLDGEIVVFDEQGRPDFGLLQPRMMAKSNAAALARANPVTLFVFDLLYLDGYDLRRAALVERKRLLASIIKPGALVRYSEHFAGNGRQMLEFAAQGVHVRRAPQPRLGESEGHRPAGLRRLRIHAGRARTVWVAGARLLRGQEADVRGQCRLRVRPACARFRGRAVEAAGHEEVAAGGPAQAAQSHRVDASGAGVQREVPVVDARRTPARAGVPGDAAGWDSDGLREGSRHRGERPHTSRAKSQKRARRRGHARGFSDEE
jgi:DNA ligase D-like protein (predicted 3'-phosphoesterase)